MKKNKWESVEVSKQVKKEEYWSKKKVANHSDSNWDDDDFQGAIRDDFLPIEKETTKVSFENVEPTDWDDEDFQGTADKKTKEIVEEKKFTVETFKSLPETESWDDEDFPVSFYDFKENVKILKSFCYKLF